MKKFSDMPLKAELVEALGKLGFVTATEVQENVLQPILEGKDVIVRSKTGTGKTLAFLIPMMQSLKKGRDVAAMVILPTRELAVQVADVSKALGGQLGFKTVTVYGGASINTQLEQLARGADIVVGTPGRIIDLMSRGGLDIQEAKYIVLDEADRMLDMGFEDDIKEILVGTRPDKQTLLFSAIMPKEIAEIAQHYMRPGHVKITVGKEEEIVVNTIAHNYTMAHGRMKFSIMLAYMDRFKPKKCIVFSRTKHESEMIHRVLLNQHYDAILLHGGLTQAKRERSLQKFRDGARFMVATNVAARGLDISNITDIINFDAPESTQDYVNRVGRSARMGKEGRAFTFVTEEEKETMQAIQYQANITLEELNLNIDKFRNIELPQRSRSFDRPGRSFGHDRNFGHERNFGHDRGSGRPYRPGGFNRERGYGGGEAQQEHGGRRGYMGREESDERRQRQHPHSDREGRGHDGRGREGGYRPRRFHRRD